jgi:hypothetical protein
MAAIAYGLPAVDRALPADRPIPAGQPYLVGGGITVVPPPHAMVDVTKTRPATDRGTALFVLDTVKYAIAVAPFTGTLDEAAVRLRRRITGTRGYQVTGDERPVQTAHGVAGVQGGYAAPDRSGRYTVFVLDGRTVEVTVSGACPELDSALAEIGTSVSSIAYRSDP